jgi:hypothetical protein
MSCEMFQQPYKDKKMTKVSSKPVLDQVSKLGLLQAIAATQPPAGEKQPESTIRRLKEVIAVSRPDVIINWTCIMHARKKAIAQGFVRLDGYNHTLTDTGMKELAGLQVKNGTQKKKKVAVPA